ncbi:DUF1345 domain-containing protein [Serratia ureilytica]
MDFAYFSFTIAVASQTADVAVGAAEVRKITPSAVGDPPSRSTC